MEHGSHGTPPCQRQQLGLDTELPPAAIPAAGGDDNQRRRLRSISSDTSTNSSAQPIQNSIHTHSQITRH